MQHTIELSARMAMNASLVPDGAKVADVGCDHGYVSLYLASKKACKKVIAMDINEGPLSHARKNIEKQYNCSSEIAWCDGKLYIMQDM